MDNPNTYIPLSTSLNSGRTEVKKPNKIIWFMVFFAFSIFIIIFLLLFFYWDDLFKNEELPSLKMTVKCEDVNLEFELISCKVVLNNSKYETSIKFKKSSGETELSKLFAFFNIKDGSIEFEKVSDIDNLGTEQELTFLLINEPTNFYLLGNLLGVKDNCETPEFLCLIDNSISFNDTENIGNDTLFANAGENLIVDENSLVILNGSESYDLNGSLLIYNWIQISGIDVILINNTSFVTNFTAPEVSSQQILVFKLTVINGNLSDSDEVIIKVNDISIEEEIVYGISAPPPFPI